MLGPTRADEVERLQTGVQSEDRSVRRELAWHRLAPAAETRDWRDLSRGRVDRSGRYHVPGERLPGCRARPSKSLCDVNDRIAGIERHGADGTCPNSAIVGCRSEEHTSELQSLRHLVCR